MLETNDYYNSYKNQLDDLFTKRFGKSLLAMGEDILNEHLMSMRIGLRARDMVYLFFDIERHFNITILEEDIKNNCLSSFNKILDLIIKLTPKASTLQNK